MAVPRVDSTLEMPIFAKIQVSMANTAEPITYRMWVLPFAEEQPLSSQPQE